MGSSVIMDKTFEFAVNTLSFCKTKSSQRLEYHIYKQLLRSGTSIGANVREAHNAESKADFIHKLGIAQKEADETIYWLDLICATNGDSEELKILKSQAEEILKIIRSIIITSKSRSKL